MITSISW